MKRSIIMTAFAVALLAVACKKDDNTIVNNSSSISVRKTFKVKYGSTVQYGLFRFSDSSLRPNTDSATANWDFGIIHANFTPNIFVNSHASGPGAAAALVQANLFDSVKMAPTSGYAYDTTATQRAIKSSDWYTYNPVTRLPQLVTPRTIIFKTADGAHYAKMEMLAVGYDTLIPAGGMMIPDSLKYTFKYSYQPNGTTTF